MSEVKRYHSALVVLHWLLAIAIAGVFIMGAFVLDGMKNDAPEKIRLLQMHVLGGAGIMLLTLLRLIVRMKTAKPAPVVTDNPKMDKVGTSVQHALYLLTVLAALSGMALAIKSDLLNVLFNQVGSLPADFEGYAAHGVHAVMAMVLIALTLVHVAGALKHQLVLKNNILARLSLRKD
jgi:cytochrome b561